MTDRDMQTDPYQISEIDFLDAQWMRDHKFNPLSVKAARLARAVVVARRRVDEAYHDLENAISELKAVCEQVKDKRESNDGAR